MPAVVCQWPPQYFIISRDARYVPVYTRVFIIRARTGLFDFPVSTRAVLRHATPRCCAYTSSIKCRINLGSLHILGRLARVQAREREMRSFGGGGGIFGWGEERRILKEDRLLAKRG